jgi:hypothetical protein
MFEDGERDLISFYEYFHGDNGAGLGASHQTGWTGCIAALQDFFGRITAADLLRVKKGEIINQLVQQRAYGKAAGGKSTKKSAKTKTAKAGTR